MATEGEISGRMKRRALEMPGRHTGRNLAAEWLMAAALVMVTDSNACNCGVGV